MKSNISKITTLLATFALPLAGMLVADTTSIQVGAGYRQDVLNWKLSDHGFNNPSHESHLHFKDLEIAFIDVKGRTSLGCCPGYVRASYEYGWIFDGRLREQINIEDRSSVDQRHRQGEVTTGHFQDITLHNDVKNSSYVWDFDIAFAYPMQCWCSELEIAPAIGFAVDHQKIKLHDRASRRDASFSSSSDSDFANSDSSSSSSNHSSYRAQWWGPWVGFDFAYNSCNCWNVYGDLEIHFGRARRHRTSHTETEYTDNYGRTKCFWGPSFRIGSNYIICENLFLDGSFQFNKYFSYNHRDDLTWTSASIQLDLGYIF